LAQHVAIDRAEKRIDAQSSLSVPLPAVRPRIRRCLDLVCSLKQPADRTGSEHEAYESPQREIECAGIEQSLKRVAHVITALDL
jgi:hypothetical protein